MRTYMIVGAGGGVHVRLFAVYSSDVESEVTIVQPEVRVESWTWMRAETDLEIGGTDWSS